MRMPRFFRRRCEVTSKEVASRASRVMGRARSKRHKDYIALLRRMDLGEVADYLEDFAADAMSVAGSALTQTRSKRRG